MHYILVDREPIEVDLMTWAKWMESDVDRQVGLTIFADYSRVSTVFLGLDYSFWGGPPLLFETMVFRGRDDWTDQYQERCSTWDEALVQHRLAVVWAVEQGYGQPVSAILNGVL